MQINVSFDSSVSGAPTGFTAAVNAVVQLFDQMFTNNITITIDVGWGEVNGQAMGSNALGESEAGALYFANYTQVRSALQAQGAPGSSTLPSTDPASSLTLIMTPAEEKALGIYSGPATSVSNPDGYVGFTTPPGYTYDFTQGLTPTQTQFYFFGVAEHEISEVLGRVSYLNFNAGTYKSIMDLYRYSANGVRNLTEAGNPSYFSTDGGATNLGDWNNYSAGNNGGDVGDWASNVTNDAFDAASYNATINAFSANDTTLMQALGWTTTSAALSSPGTLWLTRSGNDLIARVLGSSTTTTFSGWFTNEVPLSLSDGSTVGTAAIVAIVTAMANYQTANPGFNPAVATVMPSDSTLIGLLNTNWSRTIDGSAGNVTIAAGFGADTITGGTNDVADYSGSWTSVNVNFVTNSVTHGTVADTLTNILNVKGTTAYNDTMAGGGGNDSFLGGSGNDSLTAGIGANTIVAGNGADTVVLGGGNDSLGLGSGADTISLGSGNATVAVGSGSDKFVIGHGDYNANDSITGTGQDTIQFNGNSGDSLVLNGASANLHVGSTFASLTIDGTGAAGNILLNANALTQAVTLLGNVGADTLTGTSGSNDTITALNGNNSITGGSGADSITAGGGNDTINTGSGNATVSVGSGADVITLGSGNASIVLHSGADTITVGPGSDTITATGGNDIVLVGLGSYYAATDTLTLGAGTDFVRFTSTVANNSLMLNSTLTAIGGHLTIEASDAAGGLTGTTALKIDAHLMTQAVTLLGNAGADTLIGTTGQADTITALGGNNSIAGGAAADSITAGNGADTISTGSGNATVSAGTGSDSILVGNGNDSIALGFGADSIALGTGSDTIVAANGNDVVLVAAGADYAATDTLTLGSGTEIVRFTSTTAGDSLVLNGTFTATGGHLVVAASDAAGSVTGTTALKLDAHLMTQAITLLGNAGADTLIGTSGSNDTITALNGNNSIVGGAGADSITAGGGNDTINTGNGNVTVSVGGGADTILLGNGNDSIALGAGADTIALGTGSDTVTGSGGNDVVLAAAGTAFAATDTVTLGAGTDIVRFTSTMVSDSLLLNSHLTAVGGHLTVEASDASGALTGTTALKLDAHLMTQAVTLLGNAGADTLIGTTSSNDTITALGGNNSIVGGSGADSVLLGNGNDSITLGSGGDTIALGTGSDTVSAAGGNDVVLVAAGANYAAVDTLTLGAGTDFVRFTSTVSTDSLVLNGTLTATSGHLTVEASDAAGGQTGTTALKIDTHLMAQAITLLGNAGNDTLIGTTGANDTITALNGNNSIVGGTGADSITAGSGNDTINTGSGNGNDSIALGSGADSIVLGSGHDTITATGGNDIVLVAAGSTYSATDTVALGAGTDVVRFTSTVANDTLLLNGTLTALGGHLTIEASDAAGGLTGTTALKIDAHLMTQGVTLLGNGGADTLIGEAGNDTITGGHAGDILTGGGGNDVFRDTAANLNGSTITDFAIGDLIDVTNLSGVTASLAGQTLSVFSGSTLVAQINLTGPSVPNATVSSDGSTGTYISMQSVPPSLSVHDDPTATASQHVALSSLVTINDPNSVGYSMLELWDTNGTVGTGEFVVNGLAQTGGHEIDVSPANVVSTVFVAGTQGGSDVLYARLLESNGQLTAWQSYTVTVPLPSLSVSNIPTATAGQHIALSSLMTLSDPGNVGYTTLELWDTNGTVGTGEFVVNGVAQTGGHEIDVSPANVASTVFNAGTQGGSDVLYARLLESNGQLTPWQSYTVTVPLPSLSVSNIPTATAGQHIALSSLVTLGDPGNVGYTTLELWDTNGTVGTGEFVVNGVAQTGGHEIDVSPANVASTVFNAGTQGGSDVLYARLLESNGTLTAWQSYTVTVPLPTVTVSNYPTATAGQHIALSSLVTLSDPGNVGYTTLELWDTNGTVGTGEFVVNGVVQTGGHEIDVSPANAGTVTFNVGTYGGSDVLYARLLESNGQLTAWQSYTVMAPMVTPPTISVSNNANATAGQHLALSSLVTISDPASAGYSLLELWDTNGAAWSGQFVVNGVAQIGGHEIDVSPANAGTVTFNVGTYGGSDVLYARLLESNGQLTAWQSYTVTAPMAPPPTLSVSNNANATAGQHLALSSLVTISDPASAGYSLLELWDTNGMVGTGEFVVNGVAQTGGHEIDVLPANAGAVTFNVGTYGGSDVLYARLLESNGQLTAWQSYTVTASGVAAPTLGVNNDATATAGQHIALSSLVTISDPASAGYSLLELWDTNGTAVGGQFVVNGVAQTGGHEIDVSPANAGTVTFNVGTYGGSDQLYARLLESNGQLTPWQIYTVTAPAVAPPTLSVNGYPLATAGQQIALSNLVTISDPASAGYSQLELWDTNGTAAGGQFIVNGVAQTGGHEIDVAPANVAGATFNVGTPGSSDVLYARLLESNGQLTAWQSYTVSGPSLGSQAASLVSAMASFSAVGSEAVANPSAQASDPLSQLNLAAAHH